MICTSSGHMKLFAKFQNDLLICRRGCEHRTPYVDMCISIVLYSAIGSDDCYGYVFALRES